MRALQIDHHGSPADLQAREAPRPAPGPEDVLVAIEAAAINPSDVASVEGRFPQSSLPRIVGRDFAGRVVEGPKALVGAEVWGSGGDLGITRDGTHAEFLAVPQSAVTPRPKALSAEEAAASGVPYVTAWSALIELGRLQAGEWTLISGAAGAVGSAAVQIACAQGAKVIALIKNDAERERLDKEKVAAIAQSDRGDLPEVVNGATGGEGCALALNGVGGAIFLPLLGSLARGGRMVVFSAAGGR
ncbi:MAG TPA: zinc-binding alcohol dehydrogenase family protein, partial [Chthonomonadaceae bacterium]|nr:zinc-binding alcohol dehydrogenase family protein [Chthonomonadaceae bacterium]